MNSHIEGKLKIGISEFIIKSADHINMDPIVLLSLACAKAGGIFKDRGFSDAEKITMELIELMITDLSVILLDCLFEQVRSQA